MSFRRLLLSVAATSLLAGPVFADGGPAPESPPPPPPPEEEAAPPPPPPGFESSFYIEGEGGIAFAGDLFWSGPGGLGAADWEMDNGYNVGGALGIHLSPNWDVEVEAFYAEVGYEVSDSSISGLSFMANALYRFDTGGFLDPYLGAGVGATRVYYDRAIAPTDWSGGDWKFGWQVMGGLMMNLSNSVGLFVEYRFHDVIDDAVLDSGVVAEYRTHNVSGGIQVSF